MLLLVLQFVLLVVNTEAEREEVVGVLGSSVLLVPEITVDSSKNDILWTFKASNKSHDVILDHIPGFATLKQSEQFKDRLQFNALSGALTISRLNASDQGDYTFTVDGKELKIMELLVIDKVKQEVRVLGSSVLLDPELKVDPSKSEIVWNFIGRSILRHVPGHSLVELSDQFKFRLHFDTSNGALTVNGAERGDKGDYTFIVDGQELRIIQLRLVAEREEVIGVLGSSVLLDPEITVDSSKNDILWTFKASNKSRDVILDHIPGVATLELSEQFKDRLIFNALSGALTISRLNASDQGDYTFTVDEKELKIMELLVIAEREEVVGVLGSSVLLDPEITIDSSKNEILWTFKANNKSHDVILDHIPGVATSEPSEQFKDRLQFNTLSGALTISRLNASDQGDYTFTVNGKELKIMELLVIGKKFQIFVM
ncbi:obscurin-like [Hemitrygon akajei]|uniref:obscurin-like n=1 Tax=Hemitrygon akajei TaxID=2704970 RepID=UPI003BF9D8BD